MTFPMDGPSAPEATPVITSAGTMAEALARAGGGTVRAVLLYGSHLLGARPDKNSALDFVVVVSEYPAFYKALRDAGERSEERRVGKDCI